MPHRAVTGDGQTVQARQGVPCGCGAGHEIVLRTLPGEGNLRGAELFPLAQRHDAVLGGPLAGLKGRFEIFAADFDEVLPFLLALLAALGLVGAFQEILGRA